MYSTDLIPPYITHSSIILSILKVLTYYWRC